MPLDPKRLRRWFAAGAILAVLVAAYFYLRGILKSAPVAQAPRTLPGNVEKSGKGFTFSQSEGGKTLFTIRAASFEQFKEGGKAELQDVSIIVYGRDASRSDQIYGSKFSYDQSTGDITAEGEVHIDLDANSTGSAQADQTGAPETTNVIHVKTSELTFNKTSGVAHTDQRIEFRVPQASGSAVGALYDSHKSVLTLQSAVKIVRADEQKSSLAAQSASISKDPRAIIFRGATIEQPPRTMTAERLSVLLREDNSVDRILASGNVHAYAKGDKPFEVAASEGELALDNSNQLRSGVMKGDVSFESRGPSPAHGKTGRLLLSFGTRGRLAKARAEDGVDITQGPAAKSEELKAAAVDVLFGPGNHVEKATTSSGPAQIVLAQTSQKTTTTTISAGQFDAKFNAQNRLSSVFGSPDARIVSVTPGQPDRVASGHDVSATFNDQGGISAADLTGAFNYQEAQRTATAERAHYNPADDSLALIGSPRIVDTGMVITADSIQLNQKTGSAVARGDVKTTYNDLKPQANGAMFSSSDPVHVTGTTAVANRGTGVAHYTAARLWQGANIVEAPSLTFDKAHRSLLAQSDKTGRVTSVFLSPQKSGTAKPVNVTADRLTYVDSDRKAVFSGSVLLRNDDFTMTADTAQILLAARGQGGDKGGNQLDRIVAQGDIVIQEPERKATGRQLVYTASDQKFVLTGSSAKKPSIFDAEHGQISGDSLTFYTHDGRVLVGSGESSQNLTPTRIQNASTK